MNYATRHDLVLLLRRLLDLGGALVVLCLVAPLMLCTATAIRLSTPGPILVGYVCSGRNGRKFRMLEFRVPGGVIGRFILRTYIHELPHLLNVLRGDLSLAGPRAPLLSEEAHFGLGMQLKVKPGLSWNISLLDPLYETRSKKQPESVASPALRARAALELIALLAPRRVYEEEVGDALEVLDILQRMNAPAWKVWLKVFSTYVWEIVNSIREAMSAWLGKNKNNLQ